MSQQLYEALLSAKDAEVWRHSLLYRARICPVIREAVAELLPDPGDDGVPDKNACRWADEAITAEEALRPPEKHREGLRELAGKLFRDFAGRAFGVRGSTALPINELARAAFALEKKLPWDPSADAWRLDFLERIADCGELESSVLREAKAIIKARKDLSPFVKEAPTKGVPKESKSSNLKHSPGCKRSGCRELKSDREFENAAKTAYKYAPDRRNITRWIEQDKKAGLPAIFWRKADGSKATHLCLFLAWPKLRRYCGV